MSRLKFNLIHDYRCEDRGGLYAVFTTGKGISREHWFCAPNKSIAHAADEYLRDKFNMRLTKRQCDFIRKRYSEEIKRYPKYNC